MYTSELILCLKWLRYGLWPDVGARKVGEFLRCPYSFALLRLLAQLAARLLTMATTMRSGFLSRLPSRCVRILGNVSTELT